MRIKPNSSPFNYKLGDQGETLAVNHLTKQAFKILDQNYRCAFGEIDIIAEKEGRLYFFEVKTRKTHRFGRPEEAVHVTKQKKIIQVAQYYLKKYPRKNTPISFGVLAITWYDRGFDIKLIDHAFQLEEEPHS